MTDPDPIVNVDLLINDVSGPNADGVVEASRVVLRIRRKSGEQRTVTLEDLLSDIFAFRRLP